MKTVPRIGRLLDVAGLCLFAAGAGIFVWAWVGFGGVTEFVPPPDAPAWTAVEVANRYWRLQKIGMGLMMAGIGVFVVAWWSARAVQRRAAPAEQPERDDL